MPVRRPGVHARPRSARPAVPALLALACALALALAGAAAAPAQTGPPVKGVPAFEKDTTPLPKAVTGAGGSAPGEVRSGGGGGGALVRIVVGLGVVLAVVYGIYWLLRAYARSRGDTKAEERDARIEVVATTTLAPTRALHLVRVGGDVVLVGATDQGITPVRTWSGEEARRLAPLLDPPLPPPASGGGAGRVVDGLRRRTVRG